MDCSEVDYRLHSVSNKMKSRSDYEKIIITKELKTMINDKGISCGLASINYRYIPSHVIISMWLYNTSPV